MALDKFQPYLFVSAGEQSNKYLIPTYANGIAQFQAQRAQEITGLTVQFGPIQEGSGDPSPSNVRAISGRTGMTVKRCGKNIIPNIKYQSSANAVYLGAATANYELYLPVGTYTLSVEYLNNAQSGAYYRLSSDSANRTIWSPSSTAATGTFTVDKDEPLNLWLYKSDGISANSIGNFQLEAGSTATDHTPYAGQTYPVTWETEAGTVYGGTLDVISGVLTVNSFLLTLSDTITPTVTVSDYSYATNPSRWQIPIGSSAYSEYRVDGNRLDASICDGLRYNSAGISTLAEGDFRFSGVQSGGYRLLQFCPSGMPATLVDLKAELVAHPLHFVLPLATPQTYQLTPTDVQTLAGFNQIYSDAGPVIDIKF